MIREYELRVVRTWPGGPPQGATFNGSATRAEQLLRTGFLQKVSKDIRKKRAKRRSAAR